LSKKNSKFKSLSSSMIILWRNQTSSHDVNETFPVQNTSWTTNNSKPSLQSTKSSLNILSASFLSLCKFSLFFLFGCWNGLHKCSPRWVDIVGKIIAHCVDMAIHFVVASRCFSTCKFGK
jgi:hypothetical protein